MLHMPLRPFGNLLSPLVNRDFCPDATLLLVCGMPFLAWIRRRRGDSRGFDSSLWNLGWGSPSFVVFIAVVVMI